MFSLKFCTTMKRIGKDRVLDAKKSYKSNIFRTKLSNCPKVNEIEREKTEKGNNFLEKSKDNDVQKKEGQFGQRCPLSQNQKVIVRWLHCPKNFRANVVLSCLFGQLRQRCLRCPVVRWLADPWLKLIRMVIIMNYRI